MTKIGASLRTLRSFSWRGRQVGYFSLDEAQRAGFDLAGLPIVRRILLENLLRRRAGDVTAEEIAAVVRPGAVDREILFDPARVLTTDFSGLPTLLDLVAVRDAVQALGGDPAAVAPQKPVHLVVDHSISVDVDGTSDALRRNVALEFSRNGERYQFLKWGARAFPGLKIVPPGKGICHQVNLEHLAEVVRLDEEGDLPLAYPDTVVGTDSHTTMINGLGVLGWGVGGIEATAALLGQPIPLASPSVVGVELTGRLRAGATTTDLVLTLTQILRAEGVVSAFVEFVGDGLDHLTVPDRATIANMAPEYGATCGFFPIDDLTLAYLADTGRTPSQVELVETYARLQGLWRPHDAGVIAYDRRLRLDLAAVEPVVAGPHRPNERVPLSQTRRAFTDAFPETVGRKHPDSDLRDGDVVIAAITSCTNTANPRAMIAAGLLAAKARERGLGRRPRIKASLAPGSEVVVDYLRDADLLGPLEHFGFFVSGIGCTTCIGNSGPLAEAVASRIAEADLAVAAVLSGNRNFEGRIAPNVRANFLASPALVVAFAIAGTVCRDLQAEPLGLDSKGAPVWLRDIWPAAEEVDAVLRERVRPDLFEARRRALFEGGPLWDAVPDEGDAYRWDPASTYIRPPPFLNHLPVEPAPLADIRGARAIAVLGDSVTTDIIAPAGAIRPDSPAGLWLRSQGATPSSFHTYGARRGNHEIVARGALANPRLRNEMADQDGPWTRAWPDGEQMGIWDAAELYRQGSTPLILVAGREYGTGSSRDQAARGLALLGVRAVIAESFERIHRSNLVGFGILPLQFLEGESRKTWGLAGSETFDLLDLADLSPGAIVRCTAARPDGEARTFKLLCRIDTAQEHTYFSHGGLLAFVARERSIEAPEPR